MRHALCWTRRARGFTLIELMIVVGAIGVLVLIGYPAYVDSIRKSRRADAIAGLSQLQLLQERVRGQQPAYADNIASMPGPPPATSPERYYTLAITAANASGYTLTATAGSGSPQYNDTKCRVLRVTMTGGSITYSSLNAAGDADTTNANRCWPK